MFLFLCFFYINKNVVDQILLFVSDGRDYNDIEGHPLEVIRNENEALLNRVVINTYGIGSGRSMVSLMTTICKILKKYFLFQNCDKLKWTVYL